MLQLAGLLEELERSEPARAAMSILESSLSRRSVEEQGAFWRAIDLYYVSRKAPPEATVAVTAAAMPPDPVLTATL